MIRFLPAFAALSLLGACATQAPVVDPAKISASASIILAGLEQSTAAYLVSNPVSLETRARIEAADRTAHALIDNMVTAPPATLAQANAELVANIDAVVAALPPGTVSREVQAGITALEIMASVIVQTAAVSTPVQVAAQPPPVAAQAP